LLQYQELSFSSFSVCLKYSRQSDNYWIDFGFYLWPSVFSLG
jgi:hypothetical protein